MATPGDGSAPYENAGAGGKFRKRPFRRSTPASPYARPLTAVRNNNHSMLKKLVDPASRLISAGAHRLFDVFRKSLPPLSLGPPENNEEPQNVPHKEGGNGNSASISAATGISELELMLQQKTFTRSEVQRLTSLLHSKTTESPSDGSLEKHGVERDNFLAAISTPIVTSRVDEEEIASPAELAKCYMESRPNSQAPRPDSKLHPRIPITPVVQRTANRLRNLESGLVTPRSRGRSALYTMARTPYSRSPSTFSQQVVKSDYGHGAALASFQGHEGKMALKRRSSVLDNDIGSGVLLRRIRQKANLLSQRDKKELGYPFFQPPDGTGHNLLLTNEPEPKLPNYASVPAKSTQTADKILQHLDKPSPIEKGSVSTNKLRLDMLHGQALRSLEKADSPKYTPSPHDIQKPVVSKLIFQSKDETEVNGSRRFSVSDNMSTSVIGCMTDGSKDKEPIVEITDLPLKVTEEPRKKRAFQMSAPEDFFEMDDNDDDGIHDNGHVLLPLMENNKPETSAADIIKTPTLLEVSKATKLVEYKSDVSKITERDEFKAEAESGTSTPTTDSGFLGGSVSEQGLGFKIPITSPSVTTTQASEIPQSTLQMEKISPVSPFSFSANQLSEFKPNADSDSKDIESVSEFSSAPKNEDVKFSVSNKDENCVGNDPKCKSMFGKSESLFPAVSTTPPTNGIFSFGTFINNSSSTPNMTPATNPPTIPSLAPFSASASTTTTTASAAIFSTFVSPHAFSFGSAATTPPTTSMAETGNTSTSSPLATTTFGTTGSSLFGISSPLAAASTTAAGSGLFGFSSSATATSTVTAAGSGPFGISSPAVVSSTTTGSGLFGFSSSAVATSTTTGAGLFGFSSPAAATSTSGSGIFGFSSPAAAAAATSTTISTTTDSSLFGFSSPAAAALTTTTGSGLFGFSSPAAATSATTTTTTTGSGLFGFSSSAAAATTSQSQGSFFNNFSNGFQASSTSSTLFGSTGPAFGSSSSFGVASETKSGDSTSIFGSTWQQPQKSSGFGSTFTSSPSSSTFTFGASSTPISSNSSFGGPTVFGNSNLVFGAVAPNNNNNTNNDQMSMEDSMAEDSMQTQSPPVSPFGQAPVSAPGFMFGATTPTPTPAAVPFSFGGQQNQAPPPQNPFQSSSVEFNAGGGSFSLGSGGEKSNRRIVRVMKSKNRKK